MMIEEDNTEECRACLMKLKGELRHELFQAWYTFWATPGTTVADDLAKLANVEITTSDEYSKVLCSECFMRLSDSCSFISTVRRSDRLLRQRGPNTVSSSTDTGKETSLWPQPILLDKSLNGAIESAVEVEVKQEVLSEDEYGSDRMDQSWEEPKLDIKIEPEEIVAPVPTNIEVNSAFSLSERNAERLPLNGTRGSLEFLDNAIKQEPMSEDEFETETDLPLDCMLCMKQFHSVTGLKAHVIAQHSYGTVKRKTDNCPSPVKKQYDVFVCATCRRSFQTRTDLMVHETCHNKHVCFVCDAKFNTFRQLSRHGARCRPSLPASHPKTRPQLHARRLSSVEVEKSPDDVDKLPREVDNTPQEPSVEPHKSPQAKDELKTTRREQHGIKTEKEIISEDESSDTGEVNQKSNSQPSPDSTNIKDPMTDLSKQDVKSSNSGAVYTKTDINQSSSPTESINVKLPNSDLLKQDESLNSEIVNPITKISHLGSPTDSVDGKLYTDILIEGEPTNSEAVSSKPDNDQPSNAVDSIDIFIANTAVLIEKCESSSRVVEPHTDNSELDIPTDSDVGLSNTDELEEKQELSEIVNSETDNIQPSTPTESTIKLVNIDTLKENYESPLLDSDNTNTESSQVDSTDVSFSNTDVLNQDEPCNSEVDNPKTKNSPVDSINDVSLHSKTSNLNIDNSQPNSPGDNPIDDKLPSIALQKQEDLLILLSPEESETAPSVTDQESKLQNSNRHEDEDVNISLQYIPSASEINKSMEVHLAINPIDEDDAMLLDSKMDVDDVDSVMSDCEPKLLSVSSELSDDIVQ